MRRQTPKQFAEQRHIATNRLITRVIAEVSKRFNLFSKDTSRMTVKAAGDDGLFDLVEANRLSKWYYAELADVIDWLKKIIDSATKQAALIGLSELGYQHSLIFGRVITQSAQTVTEESMRRISDELRNATGDRYFGNNRWNYSTAVWNLGQSARSQFDSAMVSARLDGKSAWDTAKGIEGFLSAGAECPQWAMNRLYPEKGQVSSGERPTKDKTGLIGGSPCANSTGKPSVAYNALRLARTEIAWVAGEATRKSFAISPYVTGVNVLLSNTHPKSDICDEVVANNPHPLNGSLSPSSASHTPIHPNCLCTEVSNSDKTLDEIADEVGGWVKGLPNQSLDKYATTLGFSVTDLSQATVNNDIIAALLSPLSDWLLNNSGLHEKLLNL